MNTMNLTLPPHALSILKRMTGQLTLTVVLAGSATVSLAQTAPPAPAAPAAPAVVAPAAPAAQAAPAPAPVAPAAPAPVDPSAVTPSTTVVTPAPVVVQSQVVYQPVPAPVIVVRPFYRPLFVAPAYVGVRYGYRTYRRW